MEEDHNALRGAVGYGTRPDEENAATAEGRRSPQPTASDMAVTMAASLRQSTTAPVGSAPVNPPPSQSSGTGASDEIDRKARARVQQVLTQMPWYHAFSRAIAPLIAHVDTECLDAYLADLLERAGCNGDPIHDAMVRQVLVAEQRLHVLHAQAADAKTDAAAAIYGKLAAQLMGEVRRMALAIRDYRSPANRSTTVVHRVEQWNQAEGDQQVSYVRSEATGGSRRMKAADNEKASNENERTTHESRFTLDIEEPAACGSGTLKPASAVDSDA